GGLKPKYHPWRLLGYRCVRPSPLRDDCYGGQIAVANVLGNRPGDGVADDGLRHGLARIARREQDPGGVDGFAMVQCCRRVGGRAWRKGTLYVSALNTLLAWSGWNGSTFAKQKVLYKGPKKFTGFNGLGFGADGRLYVGVSLGNTGDHGPPTTPYGYDMLSF